MTQLSCTNLALKSKVFTALEGSSTAPADGALTSAGKSLKGRKKQDRQTSVPWQWVSWVALSSLRRAEADGHGQHRVDMTEGGMKTAKQLPLSLGVQAALEVLALPTQEECDMLQPSQAKLSQASFVGSLGFLLALHVISCFYFRWLSSCRSSGKQSPGLSWLSFAWMGMGALAEQKAHASFFKY